jgi:hypothetical protein
VFLRRGRGDRDNADRRDHIPASVIGVVVLGDSARPGWMPVAYAGFSIAVAGALALARFGEIYPVEASRPEPESEPLVGV